MSSLIRPSIPGEEDGDVMNCIYTHVSNPCMCMLFRFQAQPFFKLLGMLSEMVGGPPGMPPFTQFILQRIWAVSCLLACLFPSRLQLPLINFFSCQQVAEMCPLQCLEWLSQQVLRNKLVQTWALQDLPNWVETYLLAHNNGRVRHAAATLLVALVPTEASNRCVNR